MKKKSLLADHSLFINRELSWLEFNERVLQEGLSEQVPPLDRLKFLAIVGTNLDEFFMIRVASLKQLQKAGKNRRDAAGMTPDEQLAAIAARVHRMASDHVQGICQVFQILDQNGLSIVAPDQWTVEDRRCLRAYFDREIAPVLTPLAMKDVESAPVLANLQIHLGVVAHSPRHPEEHKIAVVPVPQMSPRFVNLPSKVGRRFAIVEDVIAAHIPGFFKGYQVEHVGTFRITRDADVPIQDDDASDLLNAVEEAILARRRRAAVRLEIRLPIHDELRTFLKSLLHLDEQDIYELNGLMGTRSLYEIINLPGFDHLREPEWPPQPPRDLLGWDDLWSAISDHDVLLFHPYESFNPVIQFLKTAAQDPNVLAIKQTLYRTSGDSPIIEALEQAGRNGKEVTVLVEVKARFDEERNIHWARRLEDAGCHVIYGIAGLKTHAKASLVVRRESGRIRRYVHLGTGNYNDKTARIYSDIGLFTCHPEITLDVASFFNLLTGYSEAVGWQKLTIEPGQLKERFIALIQREAEVATPDHPGLIMAKTNALQDEDICVALYRASQAGVTIRLNVRGICCLRPNVAGVSEKIEVRSIVDRFLEHARIYYFANGGNEEVYLSSADWMERNLKRRLELVFPVLEGGVRRRVIDILSTYFADNVKAWQLLPDGTYRRVPSSGKPIRAQEVFYQQAVQAAQSTLPSNLRYKPLRAEQPAERQER